MFRSIKCVGIVLTGRRNDSSEQIQNWRFDGSNDDLIERYCIKRLTI